MSAITGTRRDVLDFWFGELKPADHWRKDPALDERMRTRFAALHAAAAACELSAWRDSAEGRLAEIIVLDQFSRHLFRDTPAAFAQDALALALAQEAVRTGASRVLPVAQLAFLYLPFMHSESPAIQADSMRLFAHPGMEGNLEFARRHREIIDRFGRYPHRNAILSRVSTPAELAFLAEPGSSF